MSKSSLILILSIVLTFNTVALDVNDKKSKAMLGVGITTSLLLATAITGAIILYRNGNTNNIKTHTSINKSDSVLPIPSDLIKNEDDIRADKNFKLKKAIATSKNSGTDINDDASIEKKTGISKTINISNDPNIDTNDTMDVGNGLSIKQEINDSLNPRIHVDNEIESSGYLSDLFSNIHSKNVNKVDDMGFTPLMLAVSLGHYEACSHILKISNEGIDMKNNTTGNTALITAIQNGHPNIVKLLIDNGANKDIENNMGRTAEDYARNINTMMVFNKFPQSCNPGKRRMTRSLSTNEIQGIRYLVCH